MHISIVIPVYNSAGYLRRCLAAIAASSHREFECLVVDDGSNDDSAAVAEQAGVRVLRLERRSGPARARNRGVAQARGDVVAFCDADVCFHPDTLARMVAHLTQHPEADAVMGSYDDSPDDPGFVSQFKNLFHHFIHQRSRRRAWTFWAGCGAVRREVFLGAGGFDERYTRPCIEDIELGTRLAAAGHRIDLEPSIQATHLKRWTLRGLIRADLCDRAIPWFALILRTGRMPPDLNLTHAHRVSVALAWLLAAATPLLVAAPAALGGVGLAWAASLWLPLAAALTGLNLDLYRFLADKRGWGFALRAVPLHWLYYFYSGLGAVVATWRALGPRRAAARAVP